MCFISIYKHLTFSLLILEILCQLELIMSHRGRSVKKERVRKTLSFTMLWLTSTKYVDYSFNLFLTLPHVVRHYFFFSFPFFSCNIPCRLNQPLELKLSFGQDTSGSLLIRLSSSFKGFPASGQKLQFRDS